MYIYMCVCVREREREKERRADGFERGWKVTTTKVREREVNVRESADGGM